MHTCNVLNCDAIDRRETNASKCSTYRSQTFLFITVCPSRNYNHIISSTFLLYLHIALFLPRDAMRKRGLCCRPVSVRLSVRPSRWWIVSRRLKISSNFLFGLVAPSLYSLTHVPVPNSEGNPFSGRAKYTGVGKIAIFDRNRHLSPKRYEIGPWLLWDDNRKS